MYIYIEPWAQIGGGGGDGGTRPPPPTFFQVGDGIWNVPPTFCGYDENWNFFMHFFFFFCLSNFFRMRAGKGTPTNCSTQMALPPKKVSESPPPPYQLFWDLRVTFGGSVYVPPTIRFGFAPLHRASREDYHHLFRATLTKLHHIRINHYLDTAKL